MGLDLDWNVILQAGQSGAVDMFLNFPVMDMNRNAIWRNPDKAPTGGVDRMNKFWGDEFVAKVLLMRKRAKAVSLDRSS